MTVRLKLANQMMNCPPCWENFVWACQQAKDAIEDRQWSLSDEEFAAALKPYNARAYFGRNNNYVEFATKADRLHFVLKWS